MIRQMFHFTFFKGSVGNAILAIRLTGDDRLGERT